MSNKIIYYRWPAIIKYYKIFLGMFCILLIFLYFDRLFIVYSSDFQSYLEYFINVYLIIPFAIFIIIFGIHFLSDIGVSDQGLFIEFLWKKYFIPWNEVDEMRNNFMHVKLKAGGKIWVITVNKGLPFFYIIYGLLFGYTLKPGIPIPNTFGQKNGLLNDIRHRMYTDKS